LVGIAVLVAVVVLILVRPRGAAPDPSSPKPTLAPESLGVAQPPGTPSETEGDASPVASEAPASAPPDVAILVGAGDIADCSEDGDTLTADLLETLDGTVFTLGDNAYENGSLKQFEECYGPTWGRPSIKDRTRPVVGNHEYHTPGAEGYFRYFAGAAGQRGQGWYLYDAGAWRIYVLNSNCAEIGGCESGSPQEHWLGEDLAANPRRCVAAMWHHPRFSSGEHGDAEEMTDIWRTLQDAGAELVLSGHDHSYERFGPQDASGRPDERGLVELVIGTGGRHAYDFLEPKPNSIVRETPVFGVVRLELGPDGWRFEFVPVPGDEFTDHGGGSCR
jgi:3',5'-cyclic AMP phosphodiesterase CpdA